MTPAGALHRTSDRSYGASLRYLYALQYRGMKFGLRNIRALARAAGHPEQAFPSFHVAGTNGKGSTAAFLASVLTAAGYRTGLYTSPHLVDFTERIRIDGEMIPESRLVEYVRQLRPAIEAHRATFFEATTCIAFRYFAEEGVDVAVIETGLGGRLDATNILTPLVSIVTNVDLEHQKYLGNTIRAIAREKAGIIKPGAPVVTAAEGIARQVLRRAAERVGTRMFETARLVRVARTAGTARGPRVTIRSRWWTAGPVRLGLAGNHQEGNAGLALAAIGLAFERGLFPRVDSRAVTRGLRNVRVFAGLRGRMERLDLPWGEAVLDVAHNPHAMRSFASALGALRTTPSVAVIGILKDKDAFSMLQALTGCVREVIAVRPGTDRARSIADLLTLGRKAGLTMVSGGTVRAGVARAIRLAQRATGGGRPRIVVTGSHYVVGEALGVLHKRT